MKKPNRREERSTAPQYAPAEQRDHHSLPTDGSVENEDARLYRRTDMLGPLPTEELEQMESDPNRRSDVQNLSPMGLAADPYGEGFGIPYEEEPDSPDDILPDQIRRMPNAEDEEEEREITARPREDIRPIVSQELPEG